jgi:hypothetical protein
MVSMETGEALHFLFRAELLSARETVITYARELTRRTVFVVTDWVHIHPRRDLIA